MTREELLARQSALLEGAKAEKRELTHDEQVEFDTLQRLLDTMPAEPDTAPDAPPQADQERKAEQVDVRAALEAERTRIRSIEEVCDTFGMDARSYIDSGASIDEVNAAAIAFARQHNEPLKRGRIEVTDDENDKFIRAASDGLAIRGGAKLQKPAPGHNEFRGRRLRDIAVECERRNGVSAEDLLWKSDMELFEQFQRDFYNPTAMFPILLDNTIEKSIIAGYERPPVSYDQITIDSSLPDFLIHDNDYTIGDANEWQEVPEGGEIPADSVKFYKRPQRQLLKYGKSFTYTYEMFVNDNIGVLTSIPRQYEASLEETINRQVYRFLVLNEVIYDGLPLFAPQHRNRLKTGTGITADGYQSMINAFNQMVNEEGKTITNTPAIMILPRGTEYDVERLFNSTYYPTEENPLAANPFKNKLDQFQIVQDPMLNQVALEAGLDSIPWFMLSAMSSPLAWCEICWLNGEKKMQKKRSETAHQLGVAWDFWLAWRVLPRQYRGVVKNPGIAVTTPIEVETA